MNGDPLVVLNHAHFDQLFNLNMAGVTPHQFHYISFIATKNESDKEKCFYVDCGDLTKEKCSRSGRGLCRKT